MEGQTDGRPSDLYYPLVADKNYNNLNIVGTPNTYQLFGGASISPRAISVFFSEFFFPRCLLHISLDAFIPFDSQSSTLDKNNNVQTDM